jgi:predicted metal-dependent hydrolase
MEHCRQHVACNQMLLRAYPEVEPLLTRYEADYERFLRERSLQFNVAYAEGFESMIGLTTPVAWTARDALWAESDPRVETLWKWHLAEEHEHREVMFKVYRALFGNGPRAYLTRVYGLLFAMVHIGGHIRRLRASLLEIDRRRMGEDAWRNRVRTPRQPKDGFEFLRRFVHVLSPYYDPARREPLPGLQLILEQSSVIVAARGTTRATT